MRWGSKNKNWYVDKNYKFTKYGDTFIVKVKDLPHASQVKIKYRCDSCNGVYECQFGNYFNKMTKTDLDYCPKCKGLKIKQHNKTKREEYLFPKIKEEFNKRNYILVNLEEDYKDNSSLLRYYCEKHLEKGELRISWGNFDTGGHGCKFCGGENISKYKTLDYDFVKNKFNEKNYKLLEEDYINAKTKMRYKCKKHNFIEQTILYTNLQKGHGCLFCGLEMTTNHTYLSDERLTSIQNFFRQSIEVWKEESYQIYGKRCIISGDVDDIELHHPYSYNKIFKETLAELKLDFKKSYLEYTDNEIELINKLLLDNHYKYGYGYPLNKYIHKLYHSVYKYDNDYEQFEAFKERYYSSEFDRLLEERGDFFNG